MKEIVLITGSGMIAQRLTEKLEKNNFSVRFLSRTKKGANYFTWNLNSKFIEEGAFKNVQHIIHLAGANIVDKRWTKKRRSELISSRIDTIQLIKETLKKENVKIKTFISASAIGYYGTDITENIYTEASESGKDFISDLCVEWERMADALTLEHMVNRLIKLRIGIVLSKKGGALEKMSKPIKYYLGAALGSGKQYIPWIHIDDLCDIIMFSILNENMNGIYNAVAPEHISNIDFTKAIAQKIKRPVLLPHVPGYMLRLIFGKMAMILLGGSRVSSKKMMDAGYQFTYKNVSQALDDLLPVLKS